MSDALDDAVLLGKSTLEAQRAKWLAGEPQSVESILAERPDLAAEQSIVLDLIYNEFCIQEQLGRQPDRSAYLSRFPDLRQPLEALLDVHFAAAASPPIVGQHAGSLSQPESFLATASTISRSQQTLPPDAARKETTGTAPELSGEFGRYRVLKALGRGAMGSVYLAEDTQLRRLVALKTPNIQEDDSGQVVTRFYREAMAAASLRHPNVCPIHDVGQIDGRHFISMAYIEGQPLAAFARPERLQPETWVINVVRKLAEALQIAHDNGIVHRDLKPGNVMIDVHGEPIIMDFGLARLIRSDDDIRLTRDGMILGSPAYMSPEQVEGELSRIDARADQYALGVILYELFTGRVPFHGTFAAVIAQVLSKQPDPPSKWRPGLNSQIESVCKRMMSKRPENRFPSLKTVAAELAAIQQGSPRSSRFSLSLARSTFRRVALIGAAFAVMALIAAVWFAFRGKVGRQDDPSLQPNERQAANSPSSQVPSPPIAPLRGTMNVVVLDPKDSRRRGSLSDPGVLPLKRGDQIRVKASLNRPGYIYLIWVGTDGSVSPVYPWANGNWNARPVTEVKALNLSLPESVDRAWNVQGGTPGMETLVLLARDQPLERNVSIKDLIVSLGPQPMPDARAIVWLDQVDAPNQRTRSPDFGQTSKITGTIEKTQQLLKEKLQPFFPLMQAVSFANQGS